MMIRLLWQDPVWSKVIATGILALLASTGAYFLGVLPNLLAFFSKIPGFLISSSSLPNWLIGLMTISFLILLWSLSIEIKDRIFCNSSDAVTWRYYQRDYFFGLLWVWRYSGNYIEGLHSLCPTCEYQILPKDISSYSAVPRLEYICDDCGYSAGEFEGPASAVLNKVELKIQKEIRTGNWATKVNA